MCDWQRRVAALAALAGAEEDAALERSVEPLGQASWNHAGRRAERFYVKQRGCWPPSGPHRLLVEAGGDKQGCAKHRPEHERGPKAAAAAARPGTVVDHSEGALWPARGSSRSALLAQLRSPHLAHATHRGLAAAAAARNAAGGGANFWVQFRGHFAFTARPPCQPLLVFLSITD